MENAMVALAELAVKAGYPHLDASRALEDLRRRECEANPDGEMTGHEDRVALTTRALAKAFGLDGTTVRRMTMAARFHDIGKLDVPQDILNSTGALTPEQRALVERHAEFGAQRLQAIPGIDQVMVDGARYHHERYDGLGYAKLAGEDIPLVARVIAIADVHDAMMVKRTYKAALPEAEVLGIMISSNPRVGRDAFDPALLRTFVAMRLAAPELALDDEARASLTEFAESSIDHSSTPSP